MSDSVSNSFVSHDPEPAWLALQSAIARLRPDASTSKKTIEDFAIDEDDEGELLINYRAEQSLLNGGEEHEPGIAWLRGTIQSADLVDRALAVLTTAGSDEDVSGQLLDVVGFDSVHHISEILSRRPQIQREAAVRDAMILGAFQGSSSSEATGLPATESRAGRRPEARSASALSEAPSHRPSYLPQAQITFQSESEKAQARKLQKLQRKAKADGPSNRENGAPRSLAELERLKEQQLLANAERPLYSSETQHIEELPDYPHVYASHGGQHSKLLSAFGGQLALPKETKRLTTEHYDEIIVPTPKQLPFRENERLIAISELDELARGCFPGYNSLNRLQSVVYPTAYRTNENMLVCAPTGAGKTDVAMLTVLRAIAQRLPTTTSLHSVAKPVVNAQSFKIVYVAPMKALASEVVRKMSKRLSWLGILVRELTGDMQMSRSEISATHMIVTTPEKWDVVTRKATGDGALASKVTLLIIDEVHLLHDDRGAVIEGIVARTLRQVESSQSLIRIVGLSATLPNFVDVADFLRVNRYTGLFYFDSSFRPVPLEQHFIGVRGKAGALPSRENLDRATFDKVSQLVQDGHQVMVFVHSRKDTVKTALMLREKAGNEQVSEFFLPDAQDQGKLEHFKRELGQSRNRELKELVDLGFGIHHAGMLRSDRNISERMFEAGVIKCLVCTATLAWGVNLPAYAVVIKGTQIYDSSKGAWTDLSILDVLQIFGRAGRPQYESQGVGYICTTYDKLDHYIGAITQQHPIESKFVAGMVDALNAEIALGTVSNIDDGVRWIGYTYLYVRMRKNPLVYGMTAENVLDDPNLGQKRHDQIVIAAKRLAEAKMIVYDEQLGTLTSTELGTIASKFYVRSASIEGFNETLRPSLSDADGLAALCKSVEFNQITVRDNEIDELKGLIERIPAEVSGGTDTSAGKVNILLQAYISRFFIEDFALVSDSAYVAQNAGRIARALLDIVVSRKWSAAAYVFIGLCKSIERRFWPHAHPLRQTNLHEDVLYNVDRFAMDLDPLDLIGMKDADVGKLIHLNDRQGKAVREAAQSLPRLDASAIVQPIAHDLLRVGCILKPDYTWSDKSHGPVDSWYVWVSDEQDLHMHHFARVSFTARQGAVQRDFYVPIGPSGLESAIHLHTASERWLGSDQVTDIPLAGLQLPRSPPPPLPLLDLPLFDLAGSQDKEIEEMRGLFEKESVLDPVQTQTFHTLCYTRANALVAMPDARSRSILLQMTVWRTLQRVQAGLAVVIVPDSAELLAIGRAVRLRLASTSVHVVVATSPGDITAVSERSKTVIVTMAPLLLASDLPVAPLLILAPELHLLTPDTELVLSRLRWQFPLTRVIGFSFSLYDSLDLRQWLGAAEEHTYSFGPSARPSPLPTLFDSYHIPHSNALLKAMTPPAYAYLRKQSGLTMLIVPTRAMCRVVAMDLIRAMGSDEDHDHYGLHDDFLAASVLDPVLSDALASGIAILHDGLRSSEKRVVMALVRSQAVRVVIVPREAIWTISSSLLAQSVIVMSAQSVLVDPATGDRQLSAYSIRDILQMQSFAREGGSLRIMAQAEQIEGYTRDLQHGVHLESEHGESVGLAEVIFEDVMNERAKTVQDVVDALGWTLLAQRVRSNPSFYDPLSTDEEEERTATKSSQEILSRIVDRAMDRLRAYHLVMLDTLNGIAATGLASMLHRRRWPPSVLDVYLASTFEKLLAALDRSTRLGRTYPPMPEINPAAIEGYRLRLSRATKTQLGLSDIVDHEYEGTEPSRSQHVLVGAFLFEKHRKVPPGKEMADLQALYIERVLDGLLSPGLVTASR